jgi:ubiquinone/menaquinone biosynthesis C-methylase UbiE
MTDTTTDSTADTTADTTAVPNHHRDHPGFSGATGLLAAASMTVGRGGDARLAAELVDLRPGDAVVDVGCGPGVAARVAARRGASVVGVDPAPVMLRAARLLTRVDAVRYVEGVAEALPLPDDRATVLWSIATVHHWRDLDAGLHEARRVLRPGGRFVALERQVTPGATGHASHGWTEEQAHELVRIASVHGFVGARVAGPREAGRRTLLGVVASAT